MATTSSDRWARRIGLAIGLVLALVVVLSWRIPAEGARLGADARFVAAPPRELTTAPDGQFLAARRLVPGGARVEGRLQLRNITGGAVDLRLRGRPSSAELDRLLRVELGDGGTTLFRGTLARLRSWTRGPRLGRGEERTLDAHVWLPAAAEGSEGTAVDVTLELRAAP